MFPSSCPTEANVTLFAELPFPTSLARGDARRLRRGDASSVRSSVRSMAQTLSDEVVVLSTTPIPAAVQIEELIREQAKDPEYQTYAASAGQDSLLDYNAAGILVRRVPLDGAIQVVVPAALQPRILHLEQFPHSVGHPGVTRMFRSLRKRFIWKKMAADVADTVRNCHACARNRIKERNKTSYLKLFPASSPLEYVSIDLLGPLPKTAHRNRFLLVMTDRFSKLTRTVPLRSTTAYVVAKAFCELWVFTYGPPRHVLTDNGPQFAAKFFLAVCRELGIEKVFSSTYHPQTNGKWRDLTGQS
jgi:Integrase zinc binding domain/Integrase core domain